jgi:hypothetical protein
MKNIEVYKTYKSLPQWVKDIKSRKTLYEWLNSEHPILDKEEKDYLRNIVLPFYDRVAYIAKVEADMNDSDSFQIVIAVKDDTNPWEDWEDEIEIELPPFKNGTMYVCMEPYRQYTLKDLKIKK